jgi:uncharacterized membrane protein
MFGGMWIFWLFLIGCGWLLWDYRPRYYHRRRYHREDPVEVARMRLARGEITIEEFEKIKETVLNN